VGVSITVPLCIIAHNSYKKELNNKDKEVLNLQYGAEGWYHVLIRNVASVEDNGE
jgi:hypothetical protein